MLLVISDPVTLTHQPQTLETVGETDATVEVDNSGAWYDTVVVELEWHMDVTATDEFIAVWLQYGRHMDDMFSAKSLAMLVHCPLLMNRLDMLPKTMNMMGIAAPCRHAATMPTNISNRSFVSAKRNYI